jgi:hypothetical protein
MHNDFSRPMGAIVVSDLVTEIGSKEFADMPAIPSQEITALSF